MTGRESTNGFPPAPPAPCADLTFETPLVNIDLELVRGLAIGDHLRVALDDRYAGAYLGDRKVGGIARAYARAPCRMPPRGLCLRSARRRPPASVRKRQDRARVIVVGGTSLEVCHKFPIRRLRGSGLRAAIALRNLAPSLALHTAVSGAERGELDAVAGAFGIDATTAQRSAAVVFSYFKPISPPAFGGRGARITDRFEIADKTVLQFGFLEDGVDVRAEADTRRGATS